MDTKTRIQLAALRLFNRSGSSSVTTNHIAVEAGMSPGNLYYHYRNKEEIVLALFERMNVKADDLWEEALAGLDGGVDVKKLYRLFAGNMRLFPEYLFLARELPGLLHADPALRKRYRELYVRRVADVERVLEALRDAGLMRPWKTREELRLLIDGCWVQSFFWLPYLDASGEAMSLEQFRRGAQLVLRMLAPYLTAEVHEALLALALTLKPE